MGKILTTQPFPFSHYDSEAGGYVPCGITTGLNVRGTLSEMMKLYWRVKKFSVSGSFTAYTFNDPANPVSVTWSGTTTSLADEEANLVCNDGYSTSLTDTGASVAFNLDFRGADFYVNSSPTQSLVHLYMDVTFATDQDDQSGVLLGVEGDPYTIQEFTINGFQVYTTSGQKVYYTGYIFPPGPTPLITDFTSTIVASEYWSYGGTYNTSTGEPLT